MTEEERKQEQKWSEAHAIIDELEARDRKINKCLEEKMNEFKELAALSDRGQLLGNNPLLCCLQLIFIFFIY